MRWSLLVAVAACSSSGTKAPSGSVSGVSTPVELGKLAFHDQSLSEPVGQSCADCHDDSKAFRDPETDHTTSMGVVPGRFGSRNSPSAMYTAQIPNLHLEAGELVGGLFWDGRADTLELQAAGPMMNPLEMNNPDRATVVQKLRLSAYADDFRKIYGSDALDDVDTAFDHLMEAIGSYERSPQLAPFSSKYDRYLAGQEKLSAAEMRGLAIFEDPARGNCASCHPSRPSADGAPPMFTTFGYANIGVPRYANNLFYLQPLNPDGEHYMDRGLGRTLDNPAYDGMFRIPSLRNVARTAPYGHNGFFANLGYMIDFLNTRDVGSTVVGGTCSRSSTSPETRCAWPAPEVPATMSRAVGNLHLSQQDEDDLVAFLTTLNDPK